MQKAILSVDRNGLLWITEFRHPILNRCMEGFSRAGDWDTGVVFYASMLLIGGRARKTAKFALPRLLGTLALCYVTKRLAKRSRPSVGVEGFSALLTDPDPYSFPSSHAATSWATCIAVARSVGGLGWLLPCHAALVSYSRIHVGAHYPLDVLIGATIGSVIGSL